MKLLSVVIARSVWLLDPLEINPRGISWTPVIPMIVKRYAFQEPDLETAASANELSFKLGTFGVAEDRQIEVNLTAHSDGLTADTRSSTGDSDAFLHDVLTWLSDTLGFAYESTLVKKKAYYSELVVHSEKALTGIAQKFKRFCSLLSSIEIAGQSREFEVSGFQFFADGAQGEFRPSFKFERRAGTSVAEERFWTQAHLPTDEHLKLLDKFEEMLLQ